MVVEKCRLHCRQVGNRYPGGERGVVPALDFRQALRAKIEEVRMRDRPAAQAAVRVIEHFDVDQGIEQRRGQRAEFGFFA